MKSSDATFSIHMSPCSSTLTTLTSRLTVDDYVPGKLRSYDKLQSVHPKEGLISHYPNYQLNKIHRDILVSNFQVPSLLQLPLQALGVIVVLLGAGVWTSAGGRTSPANSTALGIVSRSSSARAG